MNHRKCNTILIFLLLIGSIIIVNAEIVSTNHKKVSENIKPEISAMDCVPEGIIILWNDLTLPDGWVKCDGSSEKIPDLRDRFVMGISNNGEQPGAIGGNITHKHSYSELPKHAHTINDPGHGHPYSAWNLAAAPNEADDDGIADGVTIALEGTKILNSYSTITGISINEEGKEVCSTNQENNLPPFYRINYILSNNTLSSLPNGAIVMWHGKIEDIPEGWLLCNGQQETPNLFNRFIYGISQGQLPGATGGSTSHYHTYSDLPKHSHNIIDPGHSHKFTTWSEKLLIDRDTVGAELKREDVMSSIDTNSKTTDITINEEGINNCITDTTDNIIPPYFKMAFIMKKESIVGISSLPKGIITIWSGLTDTIPNEWILCNGMNNLAPDLSDKFIYGIDGGEQPGQIGGSITHYHTYNDLPRHKHSITDPGHKHPINVITSTTIDIDIPSWGDYPHGCGTGNSNQNTQFSATGITIGATGQDACQTDSSTHLPPYYKVAFILSNYEPPAEPAEKPSNNDDDDDDDGDNDDNSLYGNLASLMLSGNNLFITTGIIGAISSLIVYIIILKKKKSGKNKSKLIDKLLK